jgi:hypothetical protein
MFEQPFLRYYLLAEHNGCEWNPNDMAANTRTTVTLPFYAQLAWYYTPSSYAVIYH